MNDQSDRQAKKEDRNSHSGGCDQQKSDYTGAGTFFIVKKKNPFTGGLNSFICFSIPPKHQRGCCYYAQILTNMKRIQSFLFYFGTSGPRPTLTNYLSEVLRSLRTFNKAQ